MSLTNLKLARMESGASQAQLAKKADISRWRLTNLETGLIPLSQQDAECLSAALGVQADVLLAAYTPRFCRYDPNWFFAEFKKKK